MQLYKKYKEFDIIISNDQLYSLSSSDNTTQYNLVYVNDEDYIYSNLSKLGIQLKKEVIIQQSAIILSSGGGTAVHETCCVADNDRLVICCGNSVFCLALPSLSFQWQTKADDSACFEIVKHTDGYIMHGELEITRLNNTGEIVWSISGPDIFTTLDGKDTFKVVDDVVYARAWTEQTLQLNAFTGEAIK